MSHSGCALVWHFQPRVILFPYPTNDCLSYVLSYGQVQEYWIISGLHWRNVNEYRLPSKNAHSPDYCSWLVVCVNYSANFYCKIALINRFKLYLIKKLTVKHQKTKKKLNVNKNNVEYICIRLHLLNIMCDIIMSHRVTVIPWSVKHMIMLNVTWRSFDQSVKQLIGWSYDQPCLRYGLVGSFSRLYSCCCSCGSVLAPLQVCQSHVFRDLLFWQSQSWQILQISGHDVVVKNEVFLLCQ